jgi:hypothetical protein
VIALQKRKKTAADLKLAIEARFRISHPECKRAEVIINPPVHDLPWGVSLLGVNPMIEIFELSDG